MARTAHPIPRPPAGGRPDPAATRGSYPKVFIASGQQVPAKTPTGTILHVPYADLVNADGTGLVRLTNDAEIDDRPAWSPDGTTITYTRYPAGRTDDASADLMLLKLATSQSTTLTKGTDAAWSPDGSKLVFAGGDGLFVIGADGTGGRRLTTGAHRAPGWRP